MMQMLTIDRAATNAKPALLSWRGMLAASLALVVSLLMLMAFPGPAMGQGQQAVEGSIVVYPSSDLFLREGVHTANSAKEFSISLDTQPDSAVTVTLTKSNGFDDLTLDKTSLTFTADNYSTSQVIKASTDYDDDAANETGTITVSATGGIDAPNVTIDVTIREPISLPVGEIVVTPPTGDDNWQAFDEGESKNIEVALSKQPSSTVTVTLSKNDDDEITLGASSLEFTTGTWDDPQTVSVMANPDADATDDSATLTLSIDRDEGGIVALDVVESIEMTDDDGSIVLSDANDAIDLIEGDDDDDSKTFTVKLGAAPATSAVLSVTSGDPATITASPATLTFTSEDYDTAQEVTVTAVDDADSSYENVVITVSATSGITAADVTKSVDVEDDDGSIVVEAVAPTYDNNGDQTNVVDLDPIPLVEGSALRGQFGVRLSGAPASGADATVSLTSPDTGAVTVSPATLTFTSVNYATAQTVTVTAVGDADGTNEKVDITLSSSASYKAEPAKTPVEVSDDEGAIVVSSAAVSITEYTTDGDGNKTLGTGTFTVNLGAPPATGEKENVYLSITSNDTDKATVSPASLPFSPSTYNTPRTITVTAVEDADGTSEEVGITLSIDQDDYTAAAETKMIAVTDSDGKINVKIDDGRSATDTSPLTIHEGGATGVLLVSLDAAPASSAVLSVRSSDAGAVAVSPASLTFTPDNYKQVQAVIITAVGDNDTWNENATVTLSVTDGYEATSQSKPITVIDNDGIVLSDSEITLTEGGTGTFYVSLGGAPASTATVSVSSGDAGAVTASPATLTFTSADYKEAKKVTLTSVEDSDASDEEVTITLSSSGYNAPNMTMKVAVTDDEGAIELDDTGLLTITEGDAGGETFTVMLTEPVSSDVKLSLTIDEPEGRCALPAPTKKTDATVCPITISPESLTFSSGNYGVTQTVTVTARFDDDAKDENNITITIAATEGMTAPAMTKWVKVKEPTAIPTGAIEVKPLTDIEIEEGGTTRGLLEIELDTQPTSTVTISLSNQEGLVAIYPATLTIPAYGWEQNQQLEVDIVAIPDADTDDDTTEITIVAEGGIKAEMVKKMVKIADQLSGSTLIVQPSGTLHINEGATGNLSVGLGLRPTAEQTTVSLLHHNDDIKLSLSSTDAGVDPSKGPLVLTFTALNWNQPQIVFVNAAEDADADDDRDTITVSAQGFTEQRIDVLVRDHTDHLPVKAYALALPPASVQDSSTLRVHCKQDTPCLVMLDCTAQADGSLFEGRVPEAIPAHGAMTLTTADIERHTGASWAGKGRLGCALRSAERITAQVWTRSGDGVLVNNSAVLASVPEGLGYRVDIESIPSPDTPEESNLRIRCLAPAGEHCVGMSLSCYGDEGMMYKEGLITVERRSVFHLQSEELVSMIGHRWTGMGLACEIYSQHPFTVQVLTRTGGGGALVNNSATGRGR